MSFDNNMVAQEFDAFLSVLDSDSPARAALFLYGRAEATRRSLRPHRRGDGGEGRHIRSGPSSNGSGRRHPALSR